MKAYLATTCILTAAPLMAESGPAPTPQQPEHFRQGDFQAITRYPGKENHAIMDIPEEQTAGKSTDESLVELMLGKVMASPDISRLKKGMEEARKLYPEGSNGELAALAEEQRYLLTLLEALHDIPEPESAAHWQACHKIMGDFLASRAKLETTLRRTQGTEGADAFPVVDARLTTAVLSARWAEYVPMDKTDIDFAALAEDVHKTNTALDAAVAQGSMDEQKALQNQERLYKWLLALHAGTGRGDSSTLSAMQAHWEKILTRMAELAEGRGQTEEAARLRAKRDKLGMRFDTASGPQFTLSRPAFSTEMEVLPNGAGYEVATVTMRGRVSQPVKQEDLSLSIQGYACPGNGRPVPLTPMDEVRVELLPAPSAEDWNNGRAQVQVRCTAAIAAATLSSDALNDFLSRGWRVLSNCTERDSYTPPRIFQGFIITVSHKGEPVYTFSYPTSLRRKLK